MSKLRKKGFTLIELIAVLVIMAILALIVTPLVMNIIRKARIAADKRIIDAYGRSIELAIAGYLLDNGKFPTSIDQLTIEYSGSVVVCSTTKLNSDSSIYLTGCKVNNRDVNYAYGIDKSPSYTTYSVGDIVNYNDIDFYVIKDSGVNDNTVTLLKAEPLTVAEVNTYGGVGTDDNHVNKYPYPEDAGNIAVDINGYGGMAYYSSETCGYINHDVVSYGCTTDYASSDIKYVVDAWANDNFSINDLKNKRLITKDEYLNYCIEEEYQSSPSNTSIRYIPQYDWLKADGGDYYTMSSYDDAVDGVSIIISNGDIGLTCIHQHPAVSSGGKGLVRPVVEIYKSALNN